MSDKKKYEREEKTFKNLRVHYEKEEASATVWSQIFLGWETADLNKLLLKSIENAKAIQEELTSLLALITVRRQQ